MNKLDVLTAYIVDSPYNSLIVTVSPVVIGMIVVLWKNELDSSVG